MANNPKVSELANVSVDSVTTGSNISSESENTFRSQMETQINNLQNVVADLEANYPATDHSTYDKPQGKIVCDTNTGGEEGEATMKYYATNDTVGDTFVGKAQTQTLTNKTLTAPTITAPAITGATTIGTGATITTPTITSPTVTGTITSSGINTITVDDAGAVVYPLEIIHTSDSPADDDGVGIEFTVENDNSENMTIATIEAIATDVSYDTEDADIVFKAMSGGSAVAEVARVDSVGNLTVAATGAVGLQYCFVRDRKDSGTNGGDATQVDSWTHATNQRNLNVISTNITGASLSSNNLTLPAGTYIVNGSCPAFQVSAHKCRLYDSTGSATLIMGSNAYSHTTVDGIMRSVLSGNFTLTTSSVLKVQHIYAVSKASSGFGTSNSSWSVDEIFSELTFYKIA